MIRFGPWHLPDGETHLQEWMTTVNRDVEGRLTYQYNKYDAALRYCRRGAGDRRGRARRTVELLDGSRLRAPRRV